MCTNATRINNFNRFDIVYKTAFKWYFKAEKFLKMLKTFLSNILYRIIIIYLYLKCFQLMMLSEYIFLFMYFLSDDLPWPATFSPVLIILICVVVILVLVAITIILVVKARNRSENEKGKNFLTLNQHILK